MVATLVLGLRDNSRTKMKIAEIRLTTSEMLQAMIADELAILAWQNTKDGQKGRNKPKSLLNKLMKMDVPKDELMSFDSIEDFERYMNSIEGNKICQTQ